MSDVKSPTEIRFYHLQRMPVERALGMILQRIMDRGQRALVYGGLPEHLASLDKALWAGNPNGFLPHGLAGDAAAEALRTFLQGADSQYELDYLLIVGDPRSTVGPVPMKALYPRNQDDGCSFTTIQVPSDYYYAAGSRSR